VKTPGRASAAAAAVSRLRTAVQAVDDAETSRHCARLRSRRRADRHTRSVTEAHTRSLNIVDDMRSGQPSFTVSPMNTQRPRWMPGRGRCHARTWVVEHSGRDDLRRETIRMRMARMVHSRQRAGRFRLYVAGSIALGTHLTGTVRTALDLPALHRVR